MVPLSPAKAGHSYREEIFSPDRGDGRRPEGVEILSLRSAQPAPLNKGAQLNKHLQLTYNHEKVLTVFKICF